MKKLILASKSPRRIRILKENGLKFSIKPANINEDVYENLKPIQMVKTLSLLKARKIAEKNPNAIILGADTTIDFNGKIISKPKNLTNANEILNILSGKTHKVITGYTIINGNRIETSHVITKVTFYKLANSQIYKYIHEIDVMGFAGAYGIQDGADIFVKKIEGDYLNVVGLPQNAINTLKKILQ